MSDTSRRRCGPCNQDDHAHCQHVKCQCECQDRPDPVAFLRARLDEWAQDPARAREVAAMRAIVDLHQPTVSTYSPGGGGKHLACRECGAAGEWWDVDWPCDTFLAVAGIWRDHPDYGPALDSGTPRQP